MSSNINKFISHDISNLTRLIKNLTKTLAIVNPGYYGGTIPLALNFDGTAKQVSTVNLNTEGLIMFIYIKTYNEEYPPGPLYTELQKEKIYSIYDALQMTRPIL